MFKRLISSYLAQGENTECVGPLRDIRRAFSIISFPTTFLNSVSLS